MPHLLPRVAGLTFRLVEVFSRDSADQAVRLWRRINVWLFTVPCVRRSRFVLGYRPLAHQRLPPTLTFLSTAIFFAVHVCFLLVLSRPPLAPYSVHLPSQLPLAPYYSCLRHRRFRSSRGPSRLGNTKARYGLGAHLGIDGDAAGQQPHAR